jgi:hypothetical protein
MKNVLSGKEESNLRSVLAKLDFFWERRFLTSNTDVLRLESLQARIQSRLNPAPLEDAVALANEANGYVDELMGAMPQYRDAIEAVSHARL